MALSINNPKVDFLLEKAVSLTGETKTNTVAKALELWLESLHQPQANSLAEELNCIAERCAHLPDIDTRSVDEILGYNEYGVPE